MTQRKLLFAMSRDMTAGLNTRARGPRQGPNETPWPLRRGAACRTARCAQHGMNVQANEPANEIPERSQLDVSSVERHVQGNKPVQHGPQAFAACRDTSNAAATRSRTSPEL